MTTCVSDNNILDVQIVTTKQLHVKCLIAYKKYTIYTFVYIPFLLFVTHICNISCLLHVKITPQVVDDHEHASIK